MAQFKTTCQYELPSVTAPADLFKRVCLPYGELYVSLVVLEKEL
jgi:hypothetical protein